MRSLRALQMAGGTSRPWVTERCYNKRVHITAEKELLHSRNDWSSSFCFARSQEWCAVLYCTVGLYHAVPYCTTLYCAVLYSLDTVVQLSLLLLKPPDFRLRCTTSKYSTVLSTPRMKVQKSNSEWHLRKSKILVSLKMESRNGPSLPACNLQFSSL